MDKKILAAKENKNIITSREGETTKAIESQTAKMPSDLFLWGSVASMSTSLCLKLMRKSHWALFVGQWVSPILIMGLYNKLVKTEGHDQYSKELDK